MAYKKYIKRGGKLYGPYVYESRREGDRVISVYKGTVESEKNRIKRHFVPVIAIFSIVFALAVLLFVFINLPHPTGKITLDVSPSYQQDETISGMLKLSLKQGEIIPSSSVISINLNGEERQFLLSDLIADSPIEGSFYVENAQISGFGAGYGIVGIKTTYPDVEFKLKISKEKEEKTEKGGKKQIKEPNQTLTTPEIPIEQAKTPQETSIEEPLGTTPKPPAEENQQEETPSEESDLEITGAIVEEKEEKLIDAVVSAGNPFNYALEEGETAEIVQGSVRLAGAKDKKIDESALNLQVQANQLTITTSYSETETGFGADFIGDEVKTIEIPLEKLNITAQEGTLRVALQYNDAEIIGTIADVNIGYKAPEMPQEELEEIPVEQPAENISEIPVIPEENITNATIHEINVTEINITEINQTNATEINITELNITTKLSLIHSIPDITISKNGNMTLNLSEFFANAENYTSLQPENITISIENDIATIIPEVNFTGIRNASITAYQGNGSIEEQFVINVQETNITIQTIQYQAVIGKPVKWKKIITTENPENITLKLPASSTNITLKEIKQVSITETTSLTGQVISGKVGIEFELNREPKFITFFKKLFRLTGKVTEANETIGQTSEQEVEINISTTENADYELEYYTDAPYANETELSAGSKEIVITSDAVHYENVLAYATLPKEVSSEKAVKLYWYTTKAEATKYGYLKESNQTIQNSHNNQGIITGNIAKISEKENEAENKASRVRPVYQDSNLTNSNFINVSFYNKGVESGRVASRVRHQPDELGLPRHPGSSPGSAAYIPLTGQIISELGNQTNEEIIKVEISFSVNDTDNNTLIDYIAWIVPSLSNQTYEISIIILNVHSYPSQYGNWTVEFETSGQANLTITATNEPNYTAQYTRWHNESENETLYDLKFLKVICGSNASSTLQYEWQGENCSQQECSVFIANYSCNETAQEISKVLTAKPHVLRFEFGGQVAYAYNNATAAPDINFTYPTPANNTLTTNTSIEINISITNASDLSEFKWNWNNTNYTFYNDSLVLMFNFDNVSAIGENSTLAVDVSKYGNNGTLVNGAAWNCTGGRYGCALSFDGVDDGVSVSNIDVINKNGPSYTILAWVKPLKQSGGDKSIVVKSGLNTGFHAFSNSTINTLYYVSYNDAETRFATTEVSYTENQWYYLAATFDNSTLNHSFYVNGAFIDSFVTALRSYTNTLYIGKHVSNLLAFNGSIDEVRVWNRSLTSAEINQSYMSNLNKYNTSMWGFYSNQTISEPTTNYTYNYSGCAKDTSGNENCTEMRALIIQGFAPAVTINLPIAQNYSATNISFNATLNEDGSCVYSLNAGLFNYSMQNNSNRDFNATNSSIGYGQYVVNFYCNDTAGNWNRTESRAFGIDTTNPSLNITYPRNLSYNINVSVLNYTVSDETGLSRCWFSSNNGLNNQTITCGVNMSGVNSTQGTNTWRIYVNDSAGNNNESNVTFVVDTMVPNVNITYPLNMTYNINISILNYTTSTEAQACRFSSNNGLNNQTITCGVNMSGVNSTQGTNTWRIYVNDSVNNVNQSNVTFFIDNIFPLINITSPLNNSNHSSNSIAINYTVSDTNLNTCWWTNDSGRNNKTITCGTNITGQAWLEGVNNITIWANDSLNNLNRSDIRFFIDTIKPSLNLTYPLNTSYGYNVTQLNYTISDINLQACWWSSNNGVNNVTITCGTNITGANSSEGNNTWLVSANDSVGNVNFSRVTFVKDTINPNVSTVHSPVNNGNYSNTTIILNVSVSDATIGLSAVYFNLSNSTGWSAFIQAFQSGGQWNTTLNTSLYYNGRYNLSVFANDSLNNLNSSESIVINIDKTTPLISYGTLTEADGANVTRTWIYVNVTFTEANLVNITFLLRNNTAVVNSTTFTTAIYTINWTNLPYTNYTYNATIYDAAGNLNSTATRRIKLNNAPVLLSNIPVKSWNQDTSITINLTAYFNDSDADALTFGNSAVANIGIGINQATGIATLTPDSGFVGARYVVFNVTDGSATANSNNATLSVNQAGGGGGGGGGVDGGGIVPCTPSWSCGDWSSCTQGQQTRSCTDGCGNSKAEEQDCAAEIKEPVILSYSPELYVNTANNSDVTFAINAREESGIAGLTLNVKWLVDDMFIKEETSGISIESSLLYNFNKNKVVKAVVSNGQKTKELAWNVIVLNTACNEDWQCSWLECNEQNYSIAVDCTDLNSCGTNAEKPVSVPCYLDPVTGEMKVPSATTCMPEWICAEWGGCNVVYKMEDALHGQTLTEGRQERACDDINRCQPSRLEYQPCVFNIPISMKAVKLCNENYVEIYDLQQNMLVSRIKESTIKDTTRLDVRIIATNITGYCDYCYDRIRNYDEEAVDCGGPNCPICAEIPFGINYLDIFVKWGRWLLWLLVVALTAILIGRISKETAKKHAVNTERQKHAEPRRIRLIRHQKPQGILKEDFFR